MFYNLLRKNFASTYQPLYLSLQTFFKRTDQFVKLARCIESNLLCSKLILKMPNIKKKKLNDIEVISRRDDNICKVMVSKRCQSAAEQE